MIIPASKKEVKPAKRKLRKLLDNQRITLKDLADDERCPVHYQTVKKALSDETFYWHQDLANLALEMIEEKKNALITTK
jgi:hypothetical protein